jgi:cell division protein FtsW
MAKQTQSQEQGSIDWILLSVTVALAAVGLMMVYSSSSAMGYADFGDAAYFFKRQAMWLSIGLVVMFIVSRIRYEHWT